MQSQEVYKTLAIVVTYNPEIDFLSRLFMQLKNNKVDLIVVDNASRNQNEIIRLLDDFNLKKIIKLDKNHGIAAAQNIGLKELKYKKYNYVAFFDQDSEILSNYIDAQIKEFELIRSNDKNIVAIGPIYVDKKTGYKYPVIFIEKFYVNKIFQPQKSIRASLLISSGMLVDAKSFQYIGEMSEKFFIDHVDTEWCFRASNHNCSLYVNSSIEMTHSVGDNTIKILGFNLPIHNSQRRYYATRNLFYLIFRQNNPLAWKIKEFLGVFIKFGILMIHSGDKFLQIKAFLHGIFDGIFGNFEKNKS